MGFMTRKNLARRAAAKTARRTVKTDNKVSHGTTREEVMSMPYFKVKSVAQANGIEVGDKKTAELREEVIKLLGL